MLWVHINSASLHKRPTLRTGHTSLAATITCVAMLRSCVVCSCVFVCLCVCWYCLRACVFVCLCASLYVFVFVCTPLRSCVLCVCACVLVLACALGSAFPFLIHLFGTNAAGRGVPRRPPEEAVEKLLRTGHDSRCGLAQIRAFCVQPLP